MSILKWFVIVNNSISVFVVLFPRTPLEIHHVIVQPVLVFVIYLVVIFASLQEVNRY